MAAWVVLLSGVVMLVARAARVDASNGASRHCHYCLLHFVRPQGLAADQRGDIYVADPGLGQVVELAPSGRLLRRWPHLRDPVGVAVDRHHNLYVADEDAGMITELSPDGVVLRRWGRPGVDLVTFSLPHDIAVDSSGNLYVSDWGHSRIVKFAPNGKPLAQWATEGSGPGQFIHPLGITIDRHDHVYVADEGGWRVQAFSPGGHLLSTWHTFDWPWAKFSPASLPGIDHSFGYQAGLAVDAAGNVYVTNWNDSSVREFAPSGEERNHWSQYGKGSQPFNGPSGIAVGRDGAIYVADWGNGLLARITSRVERFSAWAVR